MSVFADTSGMLPLLDADSENHAAAREAWEGIVAGDDPIVTSSYALLETFALVQSRLGMDAVRDMRERIYPALTVVWVDAELHEAAVAALTAANRRQLSLVDCVSFEVMRRRAIHRAFAIDTHFGEQGFETVPPAA